MLEANAGLLRKLLPDLPAWTWRDVTNAMRERGFAGYSQYVEVEHDAGATILAIDDGELAGCIGVEIDWADVVIADVLNRRCFEADLTIKQDLERDSALPEVA